MAKKILLADDSITIQKVVELTFSDGDYEVIATNNGAKAIQKLSEFRPDIILSDIIMPEKNGYEVCEFVKSHPEYRDIPVILLTGTFEPFDPDRAEKAGCDAVVTKPFESQSLVHKVEELIQQSQSSASFGAGAEGGAAPFEEPEPEIPTGATASEPQPWAGAAFDFATTEAPPPPPETTPFAEPPPPPPPSDSASPFDDSSARLRALFGGEAPPAEAEFRTHGDDVFGAGEASEAPAAEMPFEEPQAAAPEAQPEAPFEEPGPVPYSGDTRAFPRMSMEELEQMASSAPAEEPPAPEPPPPPAEYAGETRAFPRLTLDKLAEGVAPEPEPVPPPAEYAGETKAFPKFSFDDLSAMEPPVPPPTIEQPPLADFSGVVHPPEEPIAPPQLEPTSFEPAAEAESAVLHEGAFEPPPVEAPAPPAPDLFAEQPFEEPAPELPAEEPAAAAAEEQPWEAPAAEPASAAWSPSAFGAPEPPPLDTPFSEPAEEASEEPAAVASSESAAWSPTAPPSIQPVAVPGVGRIEPVSMPVSGEAALSDEQIEKIARRVVELMSERLIRDIAWEVIPDLAETIVKDRIRELENEA